MKKYLVLFGLIILATGIAYYISTANKLQQKPRHTLMLLDVNCDPGKTVCVAADQNYAITLYFPQQVHYLKPFKMEVTTKGLDLPDIESVNIDYTMVGMDMGLNRFSLAPITDVKGAQRYAGEGILPVCVSGRVDWVANVQINTAKKVYDAAFGLEVTK